MKMKLTSLALLLLAGTSIHAATITQWTFETNPPADQNNSGTSPSAAADQGNGTAFGFHGSGNTDWSTPPGNGSGNSFSANTWSINDYWQFQISTVGFENIQLSWDQVSSGTGPRDFKLQYSVNGVGYDDFSAYIVLENSSGNGGTWGSTYHSDYSFSADLSGVLVIDDVSSVYFRLVNTSTAKANDTSGPVPASGTSRIDNFTVSGTQIDRTPISSPDAGSTFLLLSLAFGGFVCAYRRGVVN